MDTSELEQRLRSAYQARAELVTPSRLSDDVLELDAPARIGPLRRPYWRAPLLAAAAVVVLAVGALLIAYAVHHHTAPPAQHPLRFTRSPTAGRPMSCPPQPGLRLRSRRWCSPVTSSAH